MSQKRDFIFNHLNQGFTIYTKMDEGNGGCPYCEKAKDFLRYDLNQSFTEVSLTTQERQIMYKIWELEAGTVPMIFFKKGKNVTQIGGYRELIRFDMKEILP